MSFAGYCVACAGVFPLSTCWVMLVLVAVAPWLISMPVVGMFWLCDMCVGLPGFVIKKPLMACALKHYNSDSSTSDDMVV